MPPRFNAHVLSLPRPRRSIQRGFLLLLTLSLMTGTLAAQNNQETEQATAKELFSEAVQLRNEGSKDSFQEAIRKFEEVLPLYQSLDDRKGQAIALYNIGYICSLLSEKQKALSAYHQALSLFTSIEDRRAAASTFHSLGAVSVDLGESQKAINYFNQALQLRQATRDRAGQGFTLHNLGLIYYTLGDKTTSLNYLLKALPLRLQAGDATTELRPTSTGGSVDDLLDENQKPLDYYTNQGTNRSPTRAVANIAKSKIEKADTNGQFGAINTLVGIGWIYADMKEGQKALEYFNQALGLAQNLKTSASAMAQAAAINNIGRLYFDSGEKQKALDNFKQARQLRQSVADKAGEFTALMNIGVTYFSLERKQEAFATYDEARAIAHDLGDKILEAKALSNLGAVSAALANSNKALDFLRLALQLRRDALDRRGEASTLYQLSRIQRENGNLEEARTQMEAALALVESLRAKITGQELRTSYFATVQEYYEFYIDILMSLHKQQPAAGHDGEALQTSERARARALLEMLAEAGADIRQGVDPTLVERERSLQQRLNATAQNQMKLLSGSYKKEQATAIATEIATLTTELQEIETQIRQTSPRYAALTQPQPLTLKEIQANVLDADTLLLEYSLGTDKSYLWAVTQTSIKSYELPKRVEIETTARRVYESLNARNQEIEGETKAQLRARIKRADAEYQAAAAHLSQMVLAPVAAQMGGKRLLIVSDGALQYIPFAALPEPTRAATAAPLAVKHEIVSLPSASTISVLRQELKGRKPAAKAVAVLADPVFESDDKRIKRAAGDVKALQGKRRELPLGMERAASESGVRGADLRIPRLEGTRDEAEQILSLVAPAERKSAINFAANRSAATSEELSQYRYVHFATHGFLDSVHPELSGIVLSLVDEKGTPQDGFLRAHEIFNLKLPAELVVLSACQTGLGKEVKGEGLVGLTRGFMYAGAPRVVVSLWSVADDATAELMTRFYRGMLRDKLRPAAALRAAQVSLMKERGWESPFYWAAFTLQGEWR